mmetsp:Transcript_21138/g.18384  ORF Transcript_21138/g.18384 Transcript_21138/m.18384 type:complete len:81 (+) Transcript_21138:43-285(+)
MDKQPAANLTPEQTITKLLDQIKTTTTEKSDLKKKLEAYPKKRIELIQDIEKISFKLSLQETNQATDKQAMQTQENELNE